MMDIRRRTIVNIPDPDGTGHRIVGFRIRDEGGLSNQLEAFDKVLKLDGDRRYAAGLEAAAKCAELESLHRSQVEIGKLREVLGRIIKGNPRCSTPQAILAWAQDEARTALFPKATTPEA